MMITEKLQLFGHNIFMSAKPSLDNLETFLKFMEKRDIKTVVPLLLMIDIYQIYNFSLIEVYEDSNLDVIHYPIKDFSIPNDLDDFDFFIKEVGVALKYSNILIHCSAGLGRTGLVTAALLIKYKKYDSLRAIELVRKSRYGAVETQAQESFLHHYDYYLNGDR